MVYLLKMVIFHGELLNNQMVNMGFILEMMDFYGIYFWYVI
jgi:hypothetical protein